MAVQAIQNSGYHLRRILNYFPQEISLAFAYGSAVFRQTGASQANAKNNMLDFVFAVDDPITWHTINLMQNRSHYSFLKYLGARQINNVQNKYGAGIYYNTLIPCHEKMIKYGIVSTDTLIEDLLHWRTLYVAGRLHKPVKILVQKENAQISTALNTNLKSAITTAFLMLPETFSEEELYFQIAGLSYSGDFRMIIGEDKTKVVNIVKPNLGHFQKLYCSILQECPQAVYKPTQGKVEVDKSPEGQFLQLMSLPKNLQQKITALVDQPGRNRDVEEVLLQVAQDPDCGIVVQQAIFGIVKSSSLAQSAKGILTAGTFIGLMKWAWTRETRSLC
ncbi:phosphatidate cytidylyltransferase, mitochondrial isoform X2 [Hyperolius riggenbachi]|uniref:phosphatidate cytidylyltransferase, mitochondrial isoform X2 n=1 Tax=Hyperolius riggenbachi TaxID=752182 RepID=UPI0035A3156A